MCAQRKEGMAHPSTRKITLLFCYQSISERKIYFLSIYHCNWSLNIVIYKINISWQQQQQQILFFLNNHYENVVTVSQMISKCIWATQNNFF